MHECAGAGDEGGSAAWGMYMAMQDMARTDTWLLPLAELLGAMLHADREQRPAMGQVRHYMTVCLAALHSVKTIRYFA